MIAYVDASVALRLAFGQANALTEWSKIDRAVSSALIKTECLRTLDRRRLRESLDDRQIAIIRSAVLSIIDTIQLVEIDESVLNRAGQPMPTGLGTLDAIHLTTALLWREMTGADLVMATHDEALAIAAKAHGLATVGVAA